jgi:hypothetical protein
MAILPGGKTMEPLRQLWNGVDTVKVNFGVAWGAEFGKLLEKLEKKKQLAMEYDEPVVFALAASKPLNQVVALHQGNRHAKYGVQVEGLSIFFSCRQLPHQDTPNLYVEAGPEYVAQNGLSALYAFMREFIAQLGGQYLWNKVSELHLTVDYEVDAVHTYEDYMGDGKCWFVTRARTRAPRYGCQETGETESTGADEGRVEVATFFKGNRLETLQIGKNQMMLRIYDKQAELAKRPRKQWEKLLWQDPNAGHVMRTEFQVRREGLKSLGYDTIEDVLDRTGELWAYLTRQWFRLYTWIDDPKPMGVYHPFWRAVQEAWTEAVPAVKKKEYQALRVQRAQQLLGQATSLAAITPTPDGKKVLNVSDLMKFMEQLLREMLPEQDIAGKVREKAIRFHCKNKADIEGVIVDDNGEIIAEAITSPVGSNRGGDVIHSPQ